MLPSGKFVVDTTIELLAVLRVVVVDCESGEVGVDVPSIGVTAVDDDVLNEDDAGINGVVLSVAVEYYLV